MVVFFLTARQSQHSIAIETLRRVSGDRNIKVVDIISKRDMCLSENGHHECEERNCYFMRGDVQSAVSSILDHPLHVQESRRVCLRNGVCPLRTLGAAMKEADVIVCDYNHVFDEQASLLDSTGRTLEESVIIVDEGHNLPQRIVDSHSHELDMRILRRALGTPSLTPFKEDLQILSEMLGALLKEANPTLEVEASTVDNALFDLCGVKTEALCEEMTSRLDSDELEENRALLTFLKEWNRFDKSAVRYVNRSRRRLRVALVDPSPISSPVFGGCYSSILMSGTLHPPSMYADLLGVSEDLECREYENPFPRENRPVLASGGVSSRYWDRCPEMYDRITDNLVEVSDSVPGNLISFFPSYGFLNKVASRLESREVDKELIVEGSRFKKAQRDSAVTRMVTDRSIHLMANINGSFAEGVDFRDNMLDVVVIVGVPFPPPSPHLEEMKSRIESRVGHERARLYVQVYPTVSKILQAAGRAIRSSTDRAVILLMDRRYLLPSLASKFPDDFEIQECEDPADFVEHFHHSQEWGTDGQGESLGAVERASKTVHD